MWTLLWQHAVDSGCCEAITAEFTACVSCMLVSWVLLVVALRLTEHAVLAFGCICAEGHCPTAPTGCAFAQVTVVLKHMFSPDELEGHPELVTELEADILTECSKQGPIDKVTVVPRMAGTTALYRHTAY